MSRLFGYTVAAVERDAAAAEAFEKKKIEAKSNYWFVYIYYIIVFRNRFVLYRTTIFV